MCNLSCISVPPRALSLDNPWPGGRWHHDVPLLPLLPPLERGGQLLGRRERLPLSLCTPVRPSGCWDKNLAYCCSKALVGAGRGGKESEVGMSRGLGGEASCRGDYGHRVSSLALVAAVLPAVEEKGSFIPTLAPPRLPPTPLAWWTENLCEERAMRGRHSWKGAGRACLLPVLRSSGICPEVGALGEGLWLSLRKLARRATEVGT